MRKIKKIHYDDHTTGWHKWFAWYPVKVYSWNGLKIDSKTTVWLEYVERKFTDIQSDLLDLGNMEYRFGPDRERLKSGVE